jgi:hypothetical protein
MKKHFVSTICFVVAIMAAWAILAYLSMSEIPYQTAIGQTPTDPYGKTFAPGDVDKNLYVPSCTIDSSLLSKPPRNGARTEDSDVQDKSQPDVPQRGSETGSLRCQA